MSIHLSLCMHLTWVGCVQDDFFEEALGLHTDGKEGEDGVPTALDSQHAKGKSKEKNKGVAKRKGMGNKARLKR